MNVVQITKKDDMVMKILHYFVTEENYKPIILRGVQNEIWLENFDKDLKLIRININYIHNEEQFNEDLWKANQIRKNIGRKTLSLKIPLLNILVDTREEMNLNIKNQNNISTLRIENLKDLKQNKYMLELFPSIKEKLVSKKTDLNEFIKLSDELNMKTFETEKKLDKVFKNKKPIVTEIFLGINIGIFLLMFFSSLINFDLYKFFISYGVNNYVLIQSQGVLGLYRLITSMFLHSDLFHIGFNMYALYIVGSQVERYYGKKKYIFIYFISGIVGSLFSNVFMSSSSMSLGASGAIFGLFGALAYFAYNYRAMLGNFLRSQIIPVILINICLGFVVSGIDVFAHIGGLIAGFFASIIVGASGKEKKLNINFVIVLSILIAFMIYILFTK